VRDRIERVVRFVGRSIALGCYGAAHFWLRRIEWLGGVLRRSELARRTRGKLDRGLVVDRVAQVVELALAQARVVIAVEGDLLD
jgi:hypothetical protein